MITRGEPWGEPTARSPDAVVTGDDADLARAALARPGALLAFRPHHRSDLARALGLGGGAQGATALPVDLLVTAEGEPAVNALVLGTAPTRLRWWSRRATLRVTVDGREVHAGPALGVVVAGGQFLDGCDAVPRGHPGDGLAEVQVYGVLRRGERSELRRRIRTGAHVPHPAIVQRRGTRVVVEADRPLPVRHDGEAPGRRRRVEVTLRPAAFRLLV